MLEVFKVIDHDRREKVIKQIKDNIQSGYGFYILVVLSALIVTLGLVTNSQAVVIGGMLIAPLFWPIIALGASIAKGDILLFRKCLIELLKATGIAVVLMTLLVIIIPFKENPGTEIMLRSEPNLLHLIIALVSGVAGAFVLIWPGITGSLAGVLMAAALMPAIGVMGYGIATLDEKIASGAFLLYITNLIAITFAATVVFIIFGFHPPKDKKSLQFMRNDLIWAVVLVVLVSIPLSYSMYNAVKKNQDKKIISQMLTLGISDLTLDQIQDIEIYSYKSENIVKVQIQAQFVPINMEVSKLEAEMQARFNKKIDLIITVIPTVEVK